MQAGLRDFLTRCGATVVMALIPVVFVAFVSVPMSLGRHPGELPTDGSPSFVLMT